MDNLTTLQQNITKELELNTLPEKERDEAVAKIGALVIETTMVRVVANLTDEDQTALEEKLAQNPTPEDLLAFLEQKEPDLNAILAEEIAAFKAEALSLKESATPSADIEA